MPVENTLFPLDSPLALRQPKTDRLILERLLKSAAQDNRLDEPVLRAAHAILVKWAEMETSGRLAELGETQLQGDFLAQVWGEALDYPGPADGLETWHRIQHHIIAGETPDAVLGHFRLLEAPQPLAVIELKGPRVHLDRDRSGGRTAVDQCWDYLLNTPPTCRWGVVSNIISFRLYERDSTKRAYEHFTLQSLRDFDTFKQFYVLFHRQGLISESYLNGPRAVALLKKSVERQREVGDKLYQDYSTRRSELIAHLHFKQKHPLDEAIEMAQRLFDRIMFIAFCEDRHLLPATTIPRAYSVAGFRAVTNPRWRSFKDLFRFINEGSEHDGIPKYNGGLFAPHAVDDLELPDLPWTKFFHTISGYDFADEVNLDVLGHLFERSITELEKLKQVGVFGDAEKSERYASMPQSVKRKQLGIYYTSSELTSRIAQYTVEELIAERFAAAAVEFGLTPADAKKGKTPDDPSYWRRCLEILRSLKIVDPACGSGAFLFQAYNVLELRYHEVIGHLEQEKWAATPWPAHSGPKKKQNGAVSEKRPTLVDQIPAFILQENLYGVDLSAEAVEITQLALWIRSATPGQTLATLSENIVHGNSLVHDPDVHPDGFVWRERFPAVFGREEAGFDCVIGNPPWERMKLQEREFFSLPAPEIATATNAAKRRQLVGKLEKKDPVLFERYEEAQRAADAVLTYCRQSGEYPLTGKGDINTYAVFAELAYQIVAPHGRVGMLVPSGVASDMTTKDFFAAIAESNRLIRLYDFENRLKTFFPDIDNRFKFCILNFGGENANTSEADYVFFAHQVEELEDRARHIVLSGADIKLLNPNTRTCPIFRTRRDAEITKAIYRRIPILIDTNREGPTGNPWGVQFKTMFHQTNDAELFREATTLKADGFKLKGNRWVKGKQTYLPLYEAKMLQDYDHRAADIVTDESNWVRQGQTAKRTLVGYQNPEQLAMPRFWVSEEAVLEQAMGETSHFLCFKDVTSPTNQRTMIAAFTPFVGVVNSAPIVLTDQTPMRQCCLLANLNSLVYDFVMRQKISYVHLNFFIVEQIPTLPPEAYEAPCSWNLHKTLESWISELVLKLTCTAEDMLPLAEACDFKSGTFQREYGGKLNKWDEGERIRLVSQLDGLFAHLYGLTEKEFAYILSTFSAVPDPVRIACSNAYRDIERGLIR